MEKQNINQKEPMNEVKFADGSVPVAVAARVYGKEAHWVRAGIIVGWLPIGTATRKGQVVKTIKEMDSRYGRINYYISPKMSTTIRPKISEKNKYYIDKHRYYELKHFCLQYPLWEKQYNELMNITKISDLKKSSRTNKITDYTAETVEKRLYYRERMDVVNKATQDADTELASYIFKAVTQGLSYEALRLQMNMPCSRDIYYDRYRRFFYLLSKYRR